MKESLGGNSKTALICTASRRRFYAEESIQSLHFAKRVKKVKNKVVKNIQLSPEQMRIMIEKLKSEVFDLKQILTKNGIDLSSARLAIKDEEPVDVAE